VAQALCLLSIICDEEVRQIVQIRFIYPDWVRWLLEEKTGHYARRPSLRMCGPGHSAETAPKPHCVLTGRKVCKVC
jgi:hypothetical protein